MWREERNHIWSAVTNSGNKNSDTPAGGVVWQLLRNGSALLQKQNIQGDHQNRETCNKNPRQGRRPGRKVALLFHYGTQVSRALKNATAIAEAGSASLSFQAQSRKPDRTRGTDAVVSGKDPQKENYGDKVLRRLRTPGQ